MQFSKFRDEEQFLSMLEDELISFNWKPCLLKSVGKFLIKSTLGIFSSSWVQLRKKKFRNKRKIFEGASKRFKDPQTVHQELSLEV